MDSLKKVIPETKIEEQQIFAASSSLSLKYQFGIFVCLVSLGTWAFPHQTFAAEVSKPLTGPMYFVIGERIVYLDKLNISVSILYEKEKMHHELDRQIELNKQVKEYLLSQKSPLASYTSTLVQLSNWKKIIALSNAESGMCKHYPVAKSNCWGIGGANLWYMGSNLSEGILSMNHFLDNYPNNSKVKYAQMSFKQMNGLYKQPPAQHWVNNNQTIFDDLTAIENSL